MLRHPHWSTSRPPSVGPAVVPTLAMAVQIPIACAFRLASGKAALTRASEVTLAVAAPKPCTPRAMASIPNEGAKPQATDPAVNTETPVKYQRRRPKRSASVAADMMKTAMPRL
ncbi:hypothetical protein MLAC_23990 [Mycobacterium lacus]|uniref:Uncharacterized protein n=1 Tax=Mycobacterium lacus TaxID=169765 RepID=A0A7I7NKE2_9MYCO|nr:hypothetical protein MLAC_23990 [Mycobacterium lacus]